MYFLAHPSAKNLERDLKEVYRVEGGKDVNIIESEMFSMSRFASERKKKFLQLSTNSYKEMEKVLREAAESDGKGTWQDRCPLVRAMHNGSPYALFKVL